MALGLFFEACNRGKDTENIQDEREKEYGNNLIDVLELHKTREELVNFPFETLWLSENLCTNGGKLYGYWTSTADSTINEHSWYFAPLRCKGER